MKIKKIIVSMFCAATLMGLTACSGVGNADGTITLRLGHNMAEDHTVHVSMMGFAEAVEEKSGGTVKVMIFPNGTLGNETDMLAQIQIGALDMGKASASALSNFSELYDVYSIPYIFDDKEHYYDVMDGEITEEIFGATAEDGFIGLTWLDSGSRSFYTVDTPIRTPEDLKGLKIRTMDSQMAISMMDKLGGSATVLGYSDIYTGLQQGVIDGAENNVTALRDHGEVAKYYSFDEHTRIPDVVVISSDVWNKMTEDQRVAVKEAANEARDAYKVAWEAFENEALERAVNDFGVELIRDVDIPAFQKAVQPIYDELKATNPTVYSYVERIRAEAEK